MGDRKQRPRHDVADLEGLARRFQDLWQEQLAATAADPEFMEMMGRWMGAIAAAGIGPPVGPSAAAAPTPDPAAWFSAMQQVLAGPGAAGRGSAGEAGYGNRSPAAGTKAAAAASRSRDMDSDQFERRLADLERRLERLEASIGGTRKSASGGARRRRS